MKKAVFILVVLSITSILRAQTNISMLYQRLQMGENKEIVDEFSYLLKDSLYADAGMFMLLGDAFRNQFDYSGALECYRRVLKLNAGNIRALESESDMYSVLGQQGKAIENLKILLMMDSTSFRVANKLAAAYQAAQEIRKAVNIYRKLYTRNVYNYNTAKTLGDCYWLLGNRDSSAYFYHRADFLNGKSLTTKLNLSQILYLNKDFNSAKIFASRGVDLDSSHVLLRKQLGNTQYKLEEYKDALFNFKYVISTGDSSASVMKLAGVCHYFMGEFNDAIPYLRRSLQVDSLNNETIYYLAASLSMTGKYEEALLNFLIALELIKPDIQVLYMIKNQLGIVYQNLKQYDDAYNSFAEAFTFNSTDSKLLYQMAMVKGEQKGEKNLEIALKHLKEFLAEIEKKGTTLTKDEIYLKSRSEWYINRITEDLFMMEKRK